jgi:hypothetical protein
MFQKQSYNLTCPNCKFTFPNGCNNGVLASHLRFCKSPLKTVALREPQITPTLVDIYHGDVSDMPGDQPDYQDGADPIEVRYLLNNAAEGDQEAEFQEVVIQMDKGYEVPMTNTISNASCTEYALHQENLCKRYQTPNPLRFRSVGSSNEVDTLHGIYLFIRKYDLSTAAGM